MDQLRSAVMICMWKELGSPPITLGGGGVPVKVPEVAFVNSPRHRQFWESRVALARHLESQDPFAGGMTAGPVE